MGAPTDGTTNSFYLSNIGQLTNLDRSAITNLPVAATNIPMARTNLSVVAGYLQRMAASMSPSDSNSQPLEPLPTI